MTASEIAEAADVPLSTTYRKLDLLAEASILAETTEIREGGHHTTKYVLDFEAVRIALSEDRDFEVSIDRPARTADERLAQLWSEVMNQVGDEIDPADLAALVTDLVDDAVADLEPVEVGMESETARVTVFGNDRTEMLASTANAAISMGAPLAAGIIFASLTVSALIFLLASL